MRAVCFVLCIGWKEAQVNKCHQIAFPTAGNVEMLWFFTVVTAVVNGMRLISFHSLKLNFLNENQCKMKLNHQVDKFAIYLNRTNEARGIEEWKKLKRHNGNEMRMNIKRVMIDLMVLANRLRICLHRLVVYAQFFFYHRFGSMVNIVVEKKREIQYNFIRFEMK